LRKPRRLPRWAAEFASAYPYERVFFATYGRLGVKAGEPRRWIGRARAALRHILRHYISAM
jgi:hypothetical protein